jgi:hypothetical protein
MPRRRPAGRRSHSRTAEPRIGHAASNIAWYRSAALRACVSSGMTRSVPTTSGDQPISLATTGASRCLRSSVESKSCRSTSWVFASTTNAARASARQARTSIEPRSPRTLKVCSGRVSHRARSISPPCQEPSRRAARRAVAEGRRRASEPQTPAIPLPPRPPASTPRATSSRARRALSAKRWSGRHPPPAPGPPDAARGGSEPSGRSIPLARRSPEEHGVRRSTQAYPGLRGGPPTSPSPVARAQSSRSGRLIGGRWGSPVISRVPRPWVRKLQAQRMITTSRLAKPMR